MKKRIVVIVMFIVCIFSNVYASGDNLINNENTYYFSEFYNTGQDNGYSEKIKLTEKDLHYGWKLGSFLISGFSGKTVDENGNIVFLKTVGDSLSKLLYTVPIILIFSIFVAILLNQQFKGRMLMRGLFFITR